MPAAGSPQTEPRPEARSCCNDAPVGEGEFAARMAAFAPFEAAPRLAVGVSGGPDSLALTMLADRWARARGGAVLGVTVDHGLRPEAAAEAAQVGIWLARRAIAHRVVVWPGPKPQSGVQAAARAARRALLTACCRREGILHLLLAHQEDDQAETLVMRLAAGSGPDGLAGIPALAESAALRVLRPLLDIPRARLAATLRAAGQAWIDDPANRNARFSRSRVRSLLSEGSKVAAPAIGFGRERAEREAQTAALLARSASVFPDGWATLEAAAFARADAELGRRALARVLMCIGGQAYPPPAAGLGRLHDAIRHGDLAGGRTLAGCRVLPRGQKLMIVRESAAIAAPQAVGGPGEYGWDGRFLLSLAGRIVPPGAAIRALGDTGWRDLPDQAKALRSLSVPPPVRATLPALYDLEGVVQVPHLTYRRKGVDPDSVTVVSAAFRPRHVLAGAGFAGLPRNPRETAGDGGETGVGHCAVR